jgi:hypothetical protein
VKEQLIFKNLLYVIDRFYHRPVVKQPSEDGSLEQVRPCSQVTSVFLNRIYSRTEASP